MFLTVQEVASRLQLSLGAVYKAIKAGTLKHHRFGTAIRISPDQLQEYIDATRFDAERTPLRSRRLKHL